MNTNHFRFTGSGDEYFKIWIVNILLSLVTLGIYSAWATVRNRRYFYGNTWLADANFEYHATPVQILVGRVIAIGLLVAYTLLSEVFPIIGFGLLVLVTLAAPWLVWRSMQFGARMSSYRNVRFSFHGTLGQAYRYFLLLPFLPLLLGGVLALGMFLAGTKESTEYIEIITVVVFATYVMFPYLQSVMTRYHVNHTQYGQGKFHIAITGMGFYGIYLRWIAVTLLATLLVGALVAVVAFLVLSGMGISFGDLASINEKENPEVMMQVLVMVVPFLFMLYLPIILLGVYTNAFLKSQIRNYVFNNAVLDNTIKLGSSLTTWGLFKMYAGNLLLVMLTAGIATPWVKVRLHRFMLAHTQVHLEGDLGQYVTQQQDLQSSLGDEMGDAFDLQGGFEVGL